MWVLKKVQLTLLNETPNRYKPVGCFRRGYIRGYTQSFPNFRTLFLTNMRRYPLRLNSIGVRRPPPVLTPETLSSSSRKNITIGVNHWPVVKESLYRTSEGTPRDGHEAP